MNKVRQPTVPAPAEDCEGLPLLGKLLNESENGLGRQTADRWFPARA